MKLPTFKVKQGIIHINNIDIMHCSEDVLVFSIDTRQKRPSYKGDTGGAFNFYVGADEETLNVEDPNAPDTEILIEDWGNTKGNMGDYWTFVEMGRYYLRFAITKVRRTAQFIEDDNFMDGSL